MHTTSSSSNTMRAPSARATGLHSGGSDAQRESSSTQPSSSSSSTPLAPSSPSPGSLCFDVVAAMNEGPGELYGHSLVLHGARLVVFGGATKAGVFSDAVWLFDLKTRRWTSVAAPPPPKDRADKDALVVRGRHFHSAVCVDDAMYVFGGKSNGYLNDLLRFDLRTLQWSVPEQRGSVPSRRYGHSACWAPDEASVLIFGGYDDLGYVSDELFAYHLPSCTWRRVACTAPPDLRLARYQHAACVHAGALWLFGGRTEQREHFVGELLHLSLATLTWARVPAKGKAPAARWGHVLLAHKGALFVVGGADHVLAFKDVHAYSLRRQSWRRVDVDDTRELEPRFFHGAVVHDHALVVFAGRNAHHYLYKDVLMAVLDAEQRQLCAAEPYALQMWRLLVESTHADVALQLSATTLYAHRGVLSARSEALAAMFRTRMREGESKAAVLSLKLAADEDAAAWRQLLFFLYCNALALPLSAFDDALAAESADALEEREYAVLVELMLLADRYLLPALKAECARRLKRHVSLGTLAALHTLAERTQSSLLLKCTQKRALLWRSALSPQLLSPSLRAFLKSAPALSGSS